MKKLTVGRARAGRAPIGATRTETADKMRSAFHQVLAEKGLKPTTWAKKSGVSPATLSAFLSAGGQPRALTFATLSKLAKGTGVPIERLTGEDSILVTNNLESLRAQVRDVFFQAFADFQSFVAEEENMLRRDRTALLQDTRAIAFVLQLSSDRLKQSLPILQKAKEKNVDEQENIESYSRWADELKRKKEIPEDAARRTTAAMTGGFPDLLKHFEEGVRMILELTMQLLTKIMKGDPRSEWVRVLFQLNTAWYGLRTDFFAASAVHICATQYEFPEAARRSNAARKGTRKR